MRYEVVQINRDNGEAISLALFCWYHDARAFQDHVASQAGHHQTIVVRKRLTKRVILSKKGWSQAHA